MDDMIQNNSPTVTLYRKFGKLLCDRILAAFILVLALPLFLIISLLVRINLGRPILFSQIRPGLNEKPFRIWKFRTMQNALGTNGKPLPDADRLSYFGKFLRSTSLDELPELWNILCGEMSFVGPRPLLMEYLNEYSGFERKRHTIRPGLTGLAQVKGRNQIPWKKKFAYDVFYVEKYNLALDAWILLNTVAKVFSREGITDSKGVSTEKFKSGKKSVVLIGAGGHAKVVIAALQSNGTKVTGIYDDNASLLNTQISGVPVVGSIDDLRRTSCDKLQVCVAIGDNNARKMVVESLKQTSVEWLTPIHKESHVDNTVTIGEGTLIAASATVQPHTKIGDHVIINTGANIDHDCVISNFSTLR